MTIYSTKRDYRKIYEQYHNISIPKDEFGRSYEIHHIDGNHYNNDINNLKLVTIQEHYDIHFSQEDFAACLAMSYRMSLSPQEAFNIASALSTKSARKRIANGTHNFTSENNRKYAQKQVEEGTHNFLGGSIQSKTAKRQVVTNTHPSQIMISCIHCKKTISVAQFKQWHGAKCKELTGVKVTNKKNRIKKTCACGATMDISHFTRYGHGDNCKHIKTSAS